MNDVECPYCGHEQEINHDDGYGYEQGELHEQECGNCEKSFSFTTQIHFSYEAHKADCLNGDDHNYERTRTYPKEMSMMECKDCGHRREMTEQERASFGIGTVKEYLQTLRRA